MKLVQLERDALLKPLQAVTGIVEKRHTLPILSNVLIERKQGNLLMMATDLEIQVATRTELEKGSGEDAGLTVSARKLQEILRALPERSEAGLSGWKNPSARRRWKLLPASEKKCNCEGFFAS